MIKNIFDITITTYFLSQLNASLGSEDIVNIIFLSVYIVQASMTFDMLENPKYLNVN